MSHIVTVRTQVRDPQAVQSACSRLKLPARYMGRQSCLSVKRLVEPLSLLAGSIQSCATPTPAKSNSITTMASGANSMNWIVAF